MRTPKHPSQRRRRNLPPETTKLPSTPPKRRLPPLPRGYLKATRDYWRTIWASPMSAVWLDADVPALLRLAACMEAHYRGESTTAHLVEARNLEDRFGLSPLARRRLQWEVYAAGAHEEEPLPDTPGEGERRPSEDDRWLRSA